MLDTKSGWSIAGAQDGLDYRSTSNRPKPFFGIASLRRHYLLVGLISTLFFGLGFFYSAHKPTTYTASTQLVIYIRQVMMGSDAVILPGRADIPLVENQIQTIRSRNVLLKVIEGLHLDKDPEFTSATPPSSSVDKASVARVIALDAVRRRLTTRRVGTSHTIMVSFTASNPKKAAEIVNKITHTYLQELSHAWDAATAKAPAIREIYKSLGPSAYLISEAEPPIRSDRPGTPLIIIGATLLGFCIGAALAILFDFLNNTIRSAEQLEYTLKLKCLGVIPRFAKEIAACKKNPTYALNPLTLPAMRRVAAILHDFPLGEVRSLGVTSTRAGEGTTSIATSLAQFLARYGKRVLLIDCVPEDASASRLPGFPHASFRSIRQESSQDSEGPRSEWGGVSVLPVEELPTIDAYSVCPDALGDCIKEASKLYDAVIVDLPSLASGPDVRATTPYLDGYLLVVRWGDTDSELIGQAIGSTGEAQAKFIGAVLNMADERVMRIYGCEMQQQTKIAEA